MRLLITGSRSWKDVELLYAILDSTAQMLAHREKDRYIKEGLTLVSGHAYGADAIAEAWFLTRFPLEQPELWHADWKKDGRRGGIIRNTAMVDSEPDLCVAFLRPCDKTGCAQIGKHWSHGATHCSDYAEHEGVRTSRYYSGELA